MIQLILQKLGIAILTIAIAIASFLGAELPQSEIDTYELGGIRFVAGKRYKLSGSGITSSATTTGLQSFQTPDGRELAMTAHFGEIGYATLEPGSTNKELISFTGISQAAASDKATLTGVTRGLDFVYPYTASSTLAKAHSGGTRLIISNPPQLYNQATFKLNDENITGTWTFASSAIPALDSYKAPTLDAEFAPKYYVDTVATSGAAEASFSHSGLVELATTTELVAGTATTSLLTWLVVPNYFFNQTSSATNLVPVTNSSGKLDQDFLDLTEAFTFTGGVTSSGLVSLASTTINNTLIVTGTSTFAGTSTFSGLPNIGSDTPTSDSQAANKKYVDNSIKDPLGTWDTVTSAHVQHASSSSGMLVAYYTGSGTCYLEAYTDGSNPPTTLRCEEHCDGTACSCTVPIRLGDYFYATTTVQSDTELFIFWIPFQ